MATHYEYHGSRYLQWTDKEGKRHKQNLGRSSVITEREAKLAVKKKEVELQTGIVFFSGVPTLLEFSFEYLDWHSREFPSSHERVRQIVEDHLIPEFGHLPLDYIKGKVVEDYKHKRRDKVKTETVVKELRTLKALLNRAFEWDILKDRPKTFGEPKSLDSKPPLFYTSKQLSAIYEADPNYRYVWQLFANTGLRRSEGAQLRTTEIHRNFIRVLSTEDERTKSAKWRDVPLTSNGKKALKKIDGEDGYVLPRMRKESLSRAAIRAAKKADLPGGLHTFRHTYCSHLVMAGVPLRTVQTLAGHAHYSTTEKYAHLAPGHLQNAGKAINL